MPQASLASSQRLFFFVDENGTTNASSQNRIHKKSYDVLTTILLAYMAYIKREPNFFKFDFLVKRAQPLKWS